MKNREKRSYALTDMAGEHFLTQDHMFLPVDEPAEIGEIWLFTTKKAAHKKLRDFRKDDPECYLSFREVIVNGLYAEPTVRWEWLAHQVCARVVRLSMCRRHYGERASLIGLSEEDYWARLIRKTLRQELRNIVPYEDWFYLFWRIKEILEVINADFVAFSRAARKGGVQWEQMAAAAILEMTREHIEQIPTT